MVVTSILYAAVGFPPMPGAAAGGVLAGLLLLAGIVGFQIARRLGAGRGRL